MGRVQGTRKLREDARRGRGIEPPVPEPLLQVSPFDVAHADKEEAVDRPSLVDRDDVRMVDRRGQLGLTEEAVAERVVLGEIDGQELQRDPPLEPQVLGEVDHAHAAQAEQRLDPVAGEPRCRPSGRRSLARASSLSEASSNDTTRTRCMEPALQPGFRRVSRQAGATAIHSPSRASSGGSPSPSQSSGRGPAVAPGRRRCAADRGGRSRAGGRRRPSRTQPSGRRWWPQPTWSTYSSRCTASRGGGRPRRRRRCHPEIQSGVALEVNPERRLVVRDIRDRRAVRLDPIADGRPGMTRPGRP